MENKTANNDANNGKVKITYGEYLDHYNWLRNLHFERKYHYDAYMLKKEWWDDVAKSGRRVYVETDNIAGPNVFVGTFKICLYGDMEYNSPYPSDAFFYEEYAGEARPYISNEIHIGRITKVEFPKPYDENGYADDWELFHTEDYAKSVKETRGY